MTIVTNIFRVTANLTSSKCPNVTIICNNKSILNWHSNMGIDTSYILCFRPQHCMISGIYYLPLMKHNDARKYDIFYCTHSLIIIRPQH